MIDELDIGSLVYLDFSSIPEKILSQAMKKFGKKALRVESIDTPPARLQGDEHAEVKGNFYRWQIKYLRVVRDQAEVDMYLEDNRNILTATKYGI